MIRFERIWESRGRVPVLLASGLIMLVIALSDWLTKPYVSLGFLYLFPIMLASAFLSRGLILGLGLGCAVLSDQFSALEHSSVRFGFEALALAGCGLFVSELVRNRRLTIDAQARFKALFETSPAAIVTVDERGIIEAANQAAVELLVPRTGSRFQR